MTFSENISKNNKKGRPPAMCAEIESMYDSINIFGETTTRRSRLNRYYRQNTFRVLHENKFCDDWLFNDELLRSGKMKMKEVIFSELGRVGRDEDVLRLARIICEKKFSTKESVYVIRNFRNVKKNKPDETDLANKIINIINEYIKYTPDLDHEVITAALRIVSYQLNERDKEYVR